MAMPPPLPNHYVLLPTQPLDADEPRFLNGTRESYAREAVAILFDGGWDWMMNANFRAALLWNPGVDVNPGIPGIRPLYGARMFDDTRLPTQTTITITDPKTRQGIRVSSLIHLPAWDQSKWPRRKAALEIATAISWLQRIPNLYLPAAFSPLFTIRRLRRDKQIARQKADQKARRAKLRRM